MNPGMATGVVFWWKASRVLLDGSALVQTIYDGSAVHIDPTQASATSRPAYNKADPNFGGRSSAVFAKGTPRIFLSDAADRLASNAPRTFFSCMRSTDAIGGTYFRLRSTNPHMQLGVAPGISNYVYVDGPSLQAGSGWPTILNTTLVVSARTPGPAGVGLDLLRVNGINITLASGAAIASDTGTPATIVGGNNTDGTQHWPGPIAEQFMINRALGVGEIKAWERYLAAEYSVRGIR